MNKLGVLEGILFVVGDEGINLNSLCEIMEITNEEAKELLLTLKNNYEKEDRGIRISYLGDAFKLTTKEEHKEYYQKLIDNPDNNILSPSTLEVLAIIAYNQPITRVEVDEMRGVSSSHIIRKLVAKGLVKEAGKSKMPGRPNLYRTTHEFLDAFGLASLSELPEINENKDIDEETELFTSIYKEGIDEVGI
ncbi:MAG: SMC-Scp complex subunit ScpB [Firmicutes bacterium]|nr:SMC-Scp complex subunit ScpB [Bacillota bacterium]